MHEITLLQGLSLAALVFVLGIDFWLEALFLFRPIIVCTLTGAILGDIQTGLITGGLTELAFAGLTPAGGVQPPNPIMAGLMTTVIAWSTGVDAKTAIGLATEVIYRQLLTPVKPTKLKAPYGQFSAIRPTRSALNAPARRVLQRIRSSPARLTVVKPMTGS